MITKEIVEKLVLENIEGSELFLVDVIVSSGNNIQVLVDSVESFSVDKCVLISRYLNSQLDRDEEDYSLEVSSPGLSSPFKVRQQFDKNMGQDIEVVLVDGDKVKGKLLAVSENGILVEAKQKVASRGSQKKKKSVPVKREIEYKEINTTKAVISFK